MQMEGVNSIESLCNYKVLGSDYLSFHCDVITISLTAAYCIVYTHNELWRSSVSRRYISIFVFPNSTCMSQLRRIFRSSSFCSICSADFCYCGCNMQKGKIGHFCTCFISNMQMASERKTLNACYMQNDVLS